MTGQELKVLRSKQIVLQNAMYVLCMTLVALFLIKVNSLKAFSLLAGVICLFSFIISLISRKRGEFIEIIIPSMKPLFEYEREKLGVEYKKLKKGQLVCLALLTVMMFVQGIIMPYKSPMTQGESGAHYFIPVALLMFVVSNMSTYLHIKKVDNSNTAELKGYANRTMLYGIIAGIVLGGLITITIIVFVSIIYVGRMNPF